MLEARKDSDDKEKVKWSFLVESESKNMPMLDDELMAEDGSIWEIPHSSVIGILKVEDSDEAKAE